MNPSKLIFFRLADVSWYSLCSLWRALRGKKWNPLRNRVDTVYLDSREQFLSTILFSLLLFLLPTVFVYFIVFKMLRFAVLATRMILLYLSLWKELAFIPKQDSRAHL